MLRGWIPGTRINLHERKSLNISVFHFINKIPSETHTTSFKVRDALHWFVWLYRNNVKNHFNFYVRTRFFPKFSCFRLERTTELLTWQRITGESARHQKLKPKTWRVFMPSTPVRSTPLIPNSHAWDRQWQELTLNPLKICFGENILVFAKDFSICAPFLTFWHHLLPSRRLKVVPTSIRVS